jgi:hypothetical protein
MIENDFPALRAAVRGSVAGNTATSITASFINAVANASVTRFARTQAAIFQSLSGSEAIKLFAIALTTACVATWALSLFVPVYVSTAIPRSTFVVLAFICAGAASSANSIAGQWSRSRLRRVTSWLRGA